MVQEQTKERLNMMMFPIHWKEAKLDRTSLLMTDFYLNGKSSGSKPILDKVMEFDSRNVEDVGELYQAIG